MCIRDRLKLTLTVNRAQPGDTEGEFKLVENWKFKGKKVKSGTWAAKGAGWNKGELLELVTPKQGTGRVILESFEAAKANMEAGLKDVDAEKQAEMIKALKETFSDKDLTFIVDKDVEVAWLKGEPPAEEAAPAEEPAADEKPAEEAK